MDNLASRPGCGQTLPPKPVRTGEATVRPGATQPQDGAARVGTMDGRPPAVLPRDYPESRGASAVPSSLHSSRAFMSSGAVSEPPVLEVGTGIVKGLSVWIKTDDGDPFEFKISPSIDPLYSVPEHRVEHMDEDTAQFSIHYPNRDYDPADPSNPETIKLDARSIPELASRLFEIYHVKDATVYEAAGITWGGP